MNEGDNCEEDSSAQAQYRLRMVIVLYMNILSDIEGFALQFLNNALT